MNIVNITNTCINLEYWLSHFKNSIFIIIPKPNKLVYNFLKIFHLINTLGKFIKKIISERLQNLSITSGFIYPNQPESLKFHSTINTGLYLTHLIHSGWIKGLHMNTLTFDIAPFFPSLNYQLLPLILDKVGFNFRIFTFFSNYLINRKTQYVWNNFVSPSFRADVGVGQRSALLPILSTLPFFIFWRKRLKISYFLF